MNATAKTELALVAAQEDIADMPWNDPSDRSLGVFEEPKIGRELLDLDGRKAKRRKHRFKWMRRPMEIPDIVLEFFDEELRENALKALSDFLIERREADPDNYYHTGFLVLNSCAIMCILLQEILQFYELMLSGMHATRSVKRVINVLTLFQTIAANPETRQKFIDYGLPNFLMPIILFENTPEVFDNIRAVALSVIGILCQSQDNRIISWALQNNVVEACYDVLKIESELCRVIAMHILENIFHSKPGGSYIGHPANERKIEVLVMRWNHVIQAPDYNRNVSPRLLYHVIRCYVILCTHPRGLRICIQKLPDALLSETFHEMKKEFSALRKLLQQLLLAVGKVG